MAKIWRGLLLGLLCCAQLSISGGRMPSRDPYLSIRYQLAFDQEDLWKQYALLMHHMGCAQNVMISSEEMQEATFEMDEKAVSEQWSAYQDACNARLNKAHYRALVEPGIHAGMKIALLWVGAAAAMLMLDKRSLDGAFAFSTAIFDSLKRMRGLIKSGYYLISPPDNPIGHYEEQFARNKCFIPRALWPKIIREFISARQNEFSREQHTHFLEFALGFTTFRPLQPIIARDKMSHREIKRNLYNRMAHFFSLYEQGPETPKELQKINLNLAKFVDQLFDRTATAPRYIYLHGPAGIGKTYFVQKLSQWIEELIPNAVTFENVVINTAQELEGAAERPGALLKVLQKQLMCNKRGSIIVLDEATWLNERHMIPAAKRVFNMDQSKLCTSYFGNGPDGAGIELAIPPILVFVASNEDIRDDALASRFDIIHYPRPTQELLCAYARAMINNSEALQEAGLTIDDDHIRAWVDDLEEKNRNFRYIAGNIEASFLI